MIKLQIRKSVNVKRCKNSLFLSFPYNAKLIGLMKAIPVRYYDAKTREWEIHSKYFDAQE